MNWLKIAGYAGAAICGIVVGFFGKSVLDKVKAEPAS
jgi:hypothetical protein